jgi:hypothetical protein
MVLKFSNLKKIFAKVEGPEVDFFLQPNPTSRPWSQDTSWLAGGPIALVSDCTNNSSPSGLSTNH